MPDSKSRAQGKNFKMSSENKTLDREGVWSTGGVKQNAVQPTQNIVQKILQAFSSCVNLPSLANWEGTSPKIYLDPIGNTKAFHSGRTIGGMAAGAGISIREVSVKTWNDRLRRGRWTRN
jgi:hypothetical protein